MENEKLTTLWRNITKLWEQQLEPLCAELGLTYVDRLILNELSKQDKISKKELANKLCTIHQNLTRSINRLSEDNFLKLRKSREDMRQVYLSLSNKGQNANEKLKLRINEIWRVSLRGIPQKELDTFYRVLNEINLNLTL